MAFNIATADLLPLRFTMAKSKESAVRWWTKIVPQLDRVRPWLVGTATAGCFFALWYWVWSEVRAQVLSAPDYAVTAESIELTPPPPRWIRSDLRRDVFQAVQFAGGLSLLDPDLAERFAGALALHPWVRSVKRVSKSYPGRIIAEVEYRRPVLLVETRTGLLPVDENAVLLPASDLTADDHRNYLRLAAIESQPLGAMGEPWGDPRVFGAARIAAAIGDRWRAWGLDHLAASVRPLSHSPEDYVYQIVARDGRRIYWGRAPGRDDAAELPALEKITRLERFFARYPVRLGGDHPQQYDIRALPTAD